MLNKSEEDVCIYQSKDMRTIYLCVDSKVIHVIRTQQNTLSNISCDDNVLNNYFHKFMNLLIWFFMS